MIKYEIMGLFIWGLVVIVPINFQENWRRPNFIDFWRISLNLISLDLVNSIRLKKIFASFLSCQFKMLLKVSIQLVII